jgi:Tol biopolymer transport system component
MKICQILLFASILIYNSVTAQNIAYLNNNGVISYCYQPKIPSLGIPQIYCINSDGTNNRRIIDATIGLSHQDWSRDTTKFAAVGYVDAYTTWSIFKFNSDGTGFIRLTNVNNVWDSDPVWSPDMSKISFTRIYPSQNMKREIWIMNSDGSGQHFTGIDGWNAKWSKNGSGFVYCSNINSNNYDIYFCDTNGANSQKLTNTATDEMCPDFSPDGTEIAYTTGSSSVTSICEIYKMNSDGTNVRRLTNNNSFDYSPKWSPDGTKFVFVSDIHEANEPEIYIMDTSGTNPQRVTYTPANITAVSPSWRNGSTTSVIKLNENIPDNCRLFQNYPNPFNPVTKINFNVKNYSAVKLIVYDVNGREVKTPVNDKLQAGSYEVFFNASELTSGVYFYRLIAGDIVTTKKMILMK